MGINATPAIHMGWVLERSDSSPSAPLYYAPRPHRNQWSDDHHAALRLARKVDAEHLRDALGIEVRIAEHLWS